MSSVCVCTWNIGEKRPCDKEIAVWLGEKLKDIYFLYVIEKENNQDSNWLSTAMMKHLVGSYEIACAINSKIGKLIIAYRRKDCEMIEIKRNEAVVCGEKYGGIGVRVLYKTNQVERYIRFLGFKMPPGEGRASQRSCVLGESFRRLFANEDEIDDHIIIAGDFQYRLKNESPIRSESRELLWQYVKERNWHKLAELDELDMERRAGRCLAGFKSQNIANIPPTFFGKAPAYTDRILWRSRAGLRSELTYLELSKEDDIDFYNVQRRHRAICQELVISQTKVTSSLCCCIAQITARYLALRTHHQVQMRAILKTTSSSTSPQFVHLGAGGGKVEWDASQRLEATCVKQTLVFNLRVHDDDDPDDDFVATAELDALSLTQTSWRSFLAPLIGDGGEICGVLSGRAIVKSNANPPLPSIDTSLGLLAAGSKVWRFKNENSTLPHTAAVRAELLYEQLRASSRQLQSLEAKLKAEHEARVAAENRAAMLSSMTDHPIIQQEQKQNGHPLSPKSPQQLRSSANFLRSIPLFQGLSEVHLAKLQEALTIRRFTAGQVIIKQGEPDGEEFYVIERGRVRVLVANAPTDTTDEHHHKIKRSGSILDATSFARVSSEAREVALLNPGDYFGERALVLKEPRASTCIADLGGVTCLVLDREAFEDAISDVGHLLGEVFSGYEHDARDLSKTSLERYVAAYADLLRALHEEEDNDDEDVVFFSEKQAAELELALVTALTPDLGVDEILDQGVKVLKDLGVVSNSCQVYFPIDIENKTVVEFCRYGNRDQSIDLEDANNRAIARAAEVGTVTNKNNVIAVPISLADHSQNDDPLRLADLTTDEDTNQVVAVLAVRDCPPASADRLAAALTSAAREIGFALRDRQPEVLLVARPRQQQTYVSAAHVATPPLIHLQAITVAPEANTSDDVIAKKIEEHRHQLKLKREEEHHHHSIKKKKKKKKLDDSQHSSVANNNDDDDEDSADSSSAAYGLYDSLIKHEGEKLFIRAALKHGDKLLAKPWDSPCVPLVRADEAMFPTLVVNFDSSVVSFAPLDKDKTMMEVRDLPQATTLEFCLRTKNKALAYCKLGYWSESNVALSGELRFSLAAGDPGRSSRRRLVRGPAYAQNDCAPCILELSAPLFESSRIPVHTLDFTVHDARASCGGMSSIALDSKSIDSILATHAVHEMNQDDTATVWQARTTLAQTHSAAALTKLALAVDWSVRDMVLEMYMLLEEWPLMPPLDALQLLSLRIVDPKIRGYAVRCLEVLTDEDLADIMLQLVQVVKFERSHDTALSRFLLRRALRNPYVCGHALYWSLATEKDVKDYDHHSCRVLVDLYVRFCGEYRVKLGHQVLIVSKLSEVSKKIKAKHELEEKELDALLQSELKSIVLPRNFQLPLSPFMVCRGLDVEKCKVLGSAQKPLWLHFLDANATKVKNNTPKHRTKNDHVVIFKCGDDLRQDQLTLQLIRTMDKYWRAAGLDLRMSPYGCVATAAKQGFIEVVQNAKTLAGISKEERFRAYGKPHFKLSRKYSAAAEAYYGTDFLLRWIKHESPAFYQERKETLSEQAEILNENRVSSSSNNPINEGPAVVEALDNFTRSLAGYCVATYVLGIGDRHNDNIMLTRNALFFHIDFGHFLGNFKEKFGIKREKAPFVFTPSFEKVLGGRNKGENYRLFEDLAIQAFLIARRHRDELLVLLMLMVDCGIPELMTLADVDWVLHTLMVDIEDDEIAAKRFRGLIVEALDCKRTRSLHAIHSLVHTH